MRRLWSRIAVALIGFIASPQALHADLVAVVNKSSHTVAFIEPVSFAVVGAVAVGENPHEIVLDAAHRHAFVTNFGSNARPGSSLSIIDLRRRAEIARIDLAPFAKPHGIARVGRHVYFTTGAPSAVGRYDIEARTLDWILETGESSSHFVVVKADPLKIYVANVAAGTVTVLSFEPESGAPVFGRIVIGQKPEGMVLSRDQKTLWVAHLGEGRISIVDTATDTVMETFEAGVAPIRLAFTHDQKMLLVTDFETGRLEVIDVASKMRLKSLAVGLRPVSLMVTPDGMRAWVAVTGEDQIVEVDLQRFEIIRSASPGAEPDGMAWIRFGRRRLIDR